jgi:predicted lipoprotein with Yx(FWY)xxD motif
MSVREHNPSDPLPRKAGIRPMAVLTLLPLVASACAGSGAASIPVPSSSTTSGAPAYQMRSGKVNGLGKVLVDGQGFTVYIFEPDNQSGTSTCFNICAAAWPPLMLPKGVASALTGMGVNQSLIGTTSRGDGAEQVTYNRWPLYQWSGDTRPGEATGQDIDNAGGLWYVISPAGNVIR